MSTFDQLTSTQMPAIAEEKKEDSPDNQSGDSSLETDDKNIEELKPPPF